MNTYIRGSSIRKISFYLDRKPLGALVMLKNLKLMLRLTVKQRKSFLFHAFFFQFRMLQFAAMNQKETIKRAEVLHSRLNLRGMDHQRMIKMELRFDKEVISSELMDDINRLFQCLLKTGHLGQITFSGLQVRVSIVSFIDH